ncbi:MAG: RidA family protein [Sulfurospirillaceae bacterium]|jgi:2-iminobutanoate/2-iminopropanoate deaminase|nr:RidA family protein [Sulfurospirillaceae bacterium]MCK9545287.1 RidA family protein [Sulfurospirillaceae bacterium]MDY0237348.1 RidA family protein [Campylobacterales bacterium]NLM98797.1 RidA family protein [Campylobacteraceae bacterium]
MKFISTPKAPKAIGPYSQAVAINGALYTSGQIALLPNGEFLSGDVKEQAKQVLKNLNEILNEAGSSKALVIKTTIFLTNMDDFLEVNKIYEDFFQTHKPARSTVEVKSLPKGALIEIEAIAALKN